MDRVKGKVAIITGGALGIGCSSSVLLAKEGAKVGITDLRETEGRELVKQITRAGGVAEYWRMDVARESEVKAVFAQIHQRFGRIDVLVNNAGIAGANKPTDQLTEPSPGRQCERRFLLHQACNPLPSAVGRRQHHQSLLHLRPDQCAGYSTLSCLQGRRPIDD